MLLPCEIAVKTLIPSLKALVAREIVMVHGLRQEEAANLLGTTQPAISQYLSGVRGKALKLEHNTRAISVISRIAKILVKSDAPPEKIMTEFCRACTIVRREGLLCELHKHLEPQLNMEECRLCGAVSNCHVR